jgi:hypothetical protein
MFLSQLEAHHSICSNIKDDEYMQETNTKTIAAHSMTELKLIRDQFLETLDHKQQVLAHNVKHDKNIYKQTITVFTDYLND